MSNQDNSPGFTTSGYIDKKGTPQGEKATFNRLPPGMDIESQDVHDETSMELKTITPMSYPGSGQMSKRQVKVDPTE